MYLGDNYCRIDEIVPENVHFNDFKEIETFAKSLPLNKYYTWIETHWLKSLN